MRHGTFASWNNCLSRKSLKWYDLMTPGINVSHNMVAVYIGLHVAVVQSLILILSSASTAPHYLAETIRPVSTRGTRQHLRSAETSTLLLPSTRCSTLGDRSFPVPTARAWNALLQHVQNAPSLSIFHWELKTVLFRSSFPDVIWQCTVLYLHTHRSLLICHHVLAATNWFYWHCTVVLQQQCDNAT